ncbi:MAG: hypothetical protein Q7S04_03810 [Candidatus Moranbacteria bacterium]|nr:hypothetical protein [Candidatus Moranbacteria bacterium]
MPTVNQKPGILFKKAKDIENLRILLERRGMELRVLIADDGSQAEHSTPLVLARMKDQLGDMFDYTTYPKNVGKTVTVIEGLQQLMADASSEDLIGCLDDNEHSFLSALDLLEKIEQGYLGAIGTIKYPDEFLSYIDRHAMPAVGAIESEIMGLKGKLCIYASGYWIQHIGIVKESLVLYPKYQKLFRELFPNEAIAIPKWGTPTLMQELMNWVLKNRQPWSEVDEEHRRMAVSYLPCIEVPALTPLGRATEKALNQLRALVLNGIVLDVLLGVDRRKAID